MDLADGSPISPDPVRDHPRDEEERDRGDVYLLRGRCTSGGLADGAVTLQVRAAAAGSRFSSSPTRGSAVVLHFLLSPCTGILSGAYPILSHRWLKECVECPGKGSEPHICVTLSRDLKIGEPGEDIQSRAEPGVMRVQGLSGISQVRSGNLQAATTSPAWYRRRTARPRPAPGIRSTIPASASRLRYSW